jgi:putative ABC transport system ATP-binding protein
MEMPGGEQRVAIARALINKPKILFADEPTANPDSVSSRQILELFRALNWDVGQTILMVTHELEDADLVDRVIWLADGEVVEREVQAHTKREHFRSPDPVLESTTIPKQPQPT